MAQQKVRSTVQLELQQRVEQILNDHHQRLKGNEVHNACALVLDVETGEVLAYAGNVNTDQEHGRDVDVIHAPRKDRKYSQTFSVCGHDR